MRYLFLFLLLLFFGCNPIDNKNGMSIWGYSRTSEERTFHAGFISTDIFFHNADGYQTNKEKLQFEEQLKEDLGFGTVGCYWTRKF